MSGPLTMPANLARRATAEPAPGPAGGASRASAVSRLPAVAVFLLVKAKPSAVPWLLMRLVLGPRALRGVAGLRFARVLGSGQGGGFVLRPGFDHGGLFLLFDDEPEAEDFIAHSPLVVAYRAHAEECLVAMLRATACRGSWAGHSMAVTVRPDPDGPVAALTRGAVRPSRAWSFWRHAAPSQAALAHADGCRLAAGLGEAPVLRQATFSVWDNVAAMEAYARQGAHRQASACAAREGHFGESMFVRFVPLWIQGRWQGRNHG